MSKTLVIYYSYEGSTKFLAEALASGIEADVVGIKPKNEMNKKGFGKYLWGGQQVFMGKVPELETIDCDMEAYDQIIVGTPVWAFSYAPPIRALFEGGKIRNKQVVMFMTCEGGPRKAASKAEELINRDNDFLGCQVYNQPIKGNQETIDALVSYVKTVFK